MRVRLVVDRYQDLPAMPFGDVRREDDHYFEGRDSTLANMAGELESISPYQQFRAKEGDGAAKEVHQEFVRRYIVQKRSFRTTEHFLRSKASFPDTTCEYLSRFLERTRFPGFFGTFPITLPFSSFISTSGKGFRQ